MRPEYRVQALLSMIILSITQWELTFRKVTLHWASQMAHGKNPLANTRVTEDAEVGSLGREDSLEEEMATPFQLFCLVNPTDRGRGAWWATAWGHKKSDTAERLSMHTHNPALTRRVSAGKEPIIWRCYFKTSISADILHYVLQRKGVLEGPPDSIRHSTPFPKVLFNPDFTELRSGRRLWVEDFWLHVVELERAPRPCHQWLSLA